MTERVVTCTMCQREQLTLMASDAHELDAGMFLYVCALCVTLSLNKRAPATSDAKAKGE